MARLVLSKWRSLCKIAVKIENPLIKRYIYIQKQNKSKQGQSYVSLLSGLIKEFAEFHSSFVRVRKSNCRVVIFRMTLMRQAVHKTTILGHSEVYVVRCRPNIDLRL
jgi:hypothetical protein